MNGERESNITLIKAVNQKIKHYFRIVSGWFCSKAKKQKKKKKGFLQDDLLLDFVSATHKNTAVEKRVNEVKIIFNTADDM